jgi:hypothetical protein
MRLENIAFEQGEEGAMPSEITVTLTLAEAYAIAKVFGGFNDNELTKRGLPRTELYGVLTGDVFNRYWDEGVDGVRLSDG